MALRSFELLPLATMPWLGKALQATIATLLASLQGGQLD